MIRIIELECDGRTSDRVMLEIHRELTSGRYVGVHSSKSRVEV